MVMIAIMNTEIIWPKNDGQHSMPEVELQVTDGKYPANAPEPAERIWLRDNYFIHRSMVAQSYHRSTSENIVVTLVVFLVALSLLKN